MTKVTKEFVEEMFHIPPPGLAEILSEPKARAASGSMDRVEASIQALRQEARTDQTGTGEPLAEHLDRMLSEVSEAHLEAKKRVRETLKTVGLSRPGPITEEDVLSSARTDIESSVYQIESFFQVLWNMDCGAVVSALSMMSNSAPDALNQIKERVSPEWAAGRAEELRQEEAA